MSCSVELARCDGCGREVPRFEVRMIARSKRDRAMLCEQCRGEAEIGMPTPARVAEPPTTC